MRPTYIYVGSGWDIAPFEEDWMRGSSVHCIDGQPHSEFGTKTLFDTNRNNVFSRPKFAKRVLQAYERAGFKCSEYDRTEILETGLLNNENLTGQRIVIVFVNTERDIIIWYHFNSGLPEHAEDIYKMVQGTYGSAFLTAERSDAPKAQGADAGYAGTPATPPFPEQGTAAPCYNGILCAGHWPHISIIETFAVPDNSLVFHGYPRTSYHVEGRNIDEIEQSVVGRLSYDDIYRKKFTHFVFHDLDGGENVFDCWDDYLEWIYDNPEMAYE